MSILEQLGTTRWAQGFKPQTCASEPCGRWLTRRQLSVRRLGITMDGMWFCSYRCIISSLDNKLRKFIITPVQSAQKSHRISIALLLLRYGHITEDHYKEAISIQRQTGEELGDLVARLGFTSELQVTEARASLWACPIIKCHPRLHAASALSSPTLNRMYSMAPMQLDISSNRLFVGFRYNVEYAPVFAMEQITGYRLQPCIISPADFAMLQQSQMPQNIYSEHVFTDFGTCTEMSNMICEMGRATNSERLALVRCGNYIWCRLHSGVRSTDLLFGVA